MGGLPLQSLSDNDLVGHPCPTSVDLSIATHPTRTRGRSSVTWSRTTRLESCDQSVDLLHNGSRDPPVVMRTHDITTFTCTQEYRHDYSIRDINPSSRI